MTRFKRFEVVDYSPSYFIGETSIFSPPRSILLNPRFPSFPFLEAELDQAFELLHFTQNPPLFLDEFDAITDLIQIEEYPVYSTARRVTRCRELGHVTERYLQSLSDRVSDLELGFDRLHKEKLSRRKKIGERKYTWTAEIKGPEKDGVDRKYKLTAEIKDGKDGKHGPEKNYKWTNEIKGKGRGHAPIERTYTFEVSSGGGSSECEKGEKKICQKGKGNGKARIVEIEDPSEHRAVVLKQGFAKRVEKSRGKRRVLSPEDAAALIQITFRAYLIRRSQALRALRELAVAKAKLKEIRALFHNFTYRRRLTGDAEERQRFSEKIIVLLLTVDAIEGADRTVRTAKRSMVDELEAMLDVVDPQPPGKSSFSTRRRQFDMPDGIMNKELVAGVAQVIQMLDREANGSEAIEE